MPGNRSSNKKNSKTRRNNKQANNKSHRKSFFPAHSQMTPAEISRLRLRQQLAKVANNKRMQNEKNYAKRLRTTGVPRRTSNNGKRANSYFNKHVSKKSNKNSNRNNN